MDWWCKHNKYLHDSDNEKDEYSKYESLLSLKAQKDEHCSEKVEIVVMGIKESLKNIEDNNHFALPQNTIRKYSTINNMDICQTTVWK